MLCKRIIPCLDVKNGRTVKGIQFEHLVDSGDPVELAARYSQEGADELVFLDITASVENRSTFLGIVSEVASTVTIPFTVGGGIHSVEDMYKLLRAGADKVSINSSALHNPSLVRDCAKEFGVQAVIVAIDAKNVEDNWFVFAKGGTVNTKKNLFEWAKTVEQLGAGELLFTSMSNDGTKSGFANEALSTLHSLLHIPIIASGGAGTVEHFLEAFTLGKADAALAASVFHKNELTISEVKQYLAQHFIPIRNTYE
jgi:cyclase